MQTRKSGHKAPRKRSTTILERQGVNGLISERAFQQSVIDLAHVYGFAVYHTFDSRRSVPGFPDLVIIGHGRCLFAELKTERGRLSVAQKGWLAALEECAGVESYVWYPHDWDEIHAVLSRRG